MENESNFNLSELDKYMPRFLFKKNKIKIVLIHPHREAEIHYIKFREDYTVTVNERKYFVIADCILFEKFPTLHYYFNNPMPIKYKYVGTDLTSESLYAIEDWTELEKSNPKITKILAQTYIDARSVHTLYNARFLSNLYDKGSFLTKKQMIIIAVALGLAVVVWLQMTGRFDVLGWLNIVY